MTTFDHGHLFPPEPNAYELLRKRINPQTPPGHYNFEQFLTWANENGKPPRPIGRFETNPSTAAPSAPPRPPLLPLNLHRQMTEEEQQSLFRLTRSPTTRDDLDAPAGF